MQQFLKKIAPYALAILVFSIIAYAYSPQVLTGKIVNQSDISSWQGMSNEIVTYNNSHDGDRTLWTNSMFSGMPATSISVIYKGDYTQNIYDLFFTGERPASYLLISLIGGFLLFLAFGVNIYLAILGAIAITFCSYNMQIIQVGHNSKMVAIAYMPWVLASIVYAYRKCPWFGALFFAFTLSFQVKANHPQITYYLAIIILGYGIWQLCAAIKDKLFPKFLKTSLLLLVAGLLGIATNINHLWPTYEYAQHTMRGGTELSANNLPDKTAPTQGKVGKKSRSGLDLDYATQWSYGIEETANLLIPNFNGGSSTGALSKNSETYKFIKQGGYQGADEIIKQLPLYWGPQPFTAGPMYMGAISIFLFILGFFILKGGLKWWIAGVSVLALMLSWGYHFMPASEFFFNWAPMYNKFRTVSMILTILQITIPIMAVLTVNEILNNEKLKDKNKVKKSFTWALALTGGFALIFALIPSLAGSFSSTSDSSLPEALISPLASDRMSLLRTDAIRTLAFIVVAAGILWFGYIKKLKATQASIILIVLVLFDLWGIDKRYLNDSHFVTKTEFDSAFKLRPVDKSILEDKDPNYRVLDLSINTFNDAYVSYHHKTIGGYSPAKLQRYQDLIERNISSEMSSIAKEIGGAGTLQDAQNTLSYHPVLSMLNTKYIVINADMPPLQNPFRLGNAWFVNDIVSAANADEEISKLNNINPAKQAIVSAADYEKIAKTKAASQIDSSATISLSSYAPNRLVYKYNSSSNQIALFSEVYYNQGWTAHISSSDNLNGKELGIFRANWILRGLSLPQGSYDIIFEFNPQSFVKGELYSRIASGILVLLLLGSIAYFTFKRAKNKRLTTDN